MNLLDQSVIKKGKSAATAPRDAAPGQGPRPAPALGAPPRRVSSRDKYSILCGRSSPVGTDSLLSPEKLKRNRCVPAGQRVHPPPSRWAPSVGTETAVPSRYRGSMGPDRQIWLLGSPGGPPRRRPRTVCLGSPRVTPAGVPATAPGAPGLSAPAPAAGEAALTAHRSAPRREGKAVGYGGARPFGGAPTRGKDAF